MRAAALLASIACATAMRAVAQQVPDASVPPTATAPPVMSAPGSARGGSGDAPGRPAYGILRQDEDWSALADPLKRTDPLDPLKFIALDRDGSAFLSFGADAYISYRAFANEFNGVFPGYDGTWNTRANLHASVTFGDRLRIYGAVKHGDVYDRNSPAAPVNRNRLDLHQAFVEVGFGDVLGAAPGDLLLRVGRQEIHYGGGSLISARLGPNVRSDYDGVLLRGRHGRIVSDLFVYRAVRDRFGVFDDGPDRGNTLWGSYTTIAGRRANVDLIYVGQHRKVSPYESVPLPVDEMRHTVGLRVWSNGPAFGGFTADFEGDYQFGRATPPGGRRLDIDAWNVIGLLSRPFAKTALTPTLGLEFGANSGDTNSADGKLGTFRAPDPPGRYFGEANAFGPGNIMGFRPYVEIHPTKALRIRPKATFFWRTTTHDGTYSLIPSVLRGANGGTKYLGVEPGLETGYVFNPHLNLLILLAHFEKSGYFDANPPSKSIDYVETTLNFRF